MKVWVTKYALTDGIYEVDRAERLPHDTDAIIMNSTIDEDCSIIVRKYGKEWTDTVESAIEIAESMRVKKINSMERKIGQLKDLKIKVVKYG